MSKSTWSGQEYSNWAAESVMGWHLNIDDEWVTSNGKFTGFIRCHYECMTATPEFNPKIKGNCAFMLHEKLMGDPWHAVSFKGQGPNAKFCITNTFSVILAVGKPVVAGHDTLIETVEEFCYKLKCMEKK